MNKTTAKPWPSFLETGMNLVAVCCILVHILLVCLASPIYSEPLRSSPPRPISWPEIESLLSKRSFESQEELFQLLHQVYSQQKDMIHLDKPIILKLSGRIQSLFPLDACQSITLQDGTVSMLFNQPQDIHIPNSWHLASLKISEHLVLRIENVQETNFPSELINHVDDNTKSVRFIIEQGYLHLDFSFLLGFLGNKFRDARGSELLYQINEKKQISSLSLIEVNPLAQQDISVKKQQPDTQTDEYSWIDIRHSDFPDSKDIGISTNKIFFLGMEIELLKEERIRFGDKESRQSSDAYRYFKTSLERLKDLIYSETKPMAVDYTRTFGYKFEERKKFLTIGFRSAKDKKRIM